MKVFIVPRVYHVKCVMLQRFYFYSPEVAFKFHRYHIKDHLMFCMLCENFCENLDHENNNGIQVFPVYIVLIKS